MTETLRALREQRWSIVGLAVAGFAITLLQSVAFYNTAGHTFAERAAFGYALSLEAVTKLPLFAPAMRPDTIGGYLELRAFAPLAILFVAWALISATGSSSLRIVSRTIGFAIASSAAAAAACAGAVLGVATGGETISGVGLVEAGLLLVALATACFAICLLVAQFAPAPTITAAGVLLSLYFVNSLSRVFAQLGAPRWLSPFRFYDASSPISPGGRFDVGAFAALLAIAAVGAGIAAIAAGRRTPARQVLSHRTFEPSREGLLATPVARLLYPMRIALVAWCLAFAALGVALVAATRSSMQDLVSLSYLLPGLPQYIFVFYAQALGQTWFEAALLMLVALVFAFVAGWVAEDGDGRLEAVLSAPYSRSAVILERVAALGIAGAVLAAVSCIAVAFTSRAAGLALDTAHLAGACLLLVAFTLALGAVGSFFASWVPRAAPSLFGGFVLAAYLVDQIGGAIRTPGWVQSLSAFRLTGTPLVNGVVGGDLALLLLVASVGLGSSILLMERRDVGA
jgi:ABC-2 type transport system permease protein